MSGLHIVSLPIQIGNLRRWAAGRAMGLDEGKALHHLLTESFGKAALQPFRLLVAPRSIQGTLYAYSNENGSELERRAREFGLPDALSVYDLAKLATKSMPTDWMEGRRLAFDVRTRPVRRLHCAAGVFQKGAEVDAFLLEAIRRYPDGPPEDGGVNREEVYREWLAERLKTAAELSQVRIHRLKRSTVNRSRRKLSGPEVTFQGELIVTNTNAFSKRLASGVGRHTAYGYGMLLLRPAR